MLPHWWSSMRIFNHIWLYISYKNKYFYKKTPGYWTMCRNMLIQKKLANFLQLKNWHNIPCIWIKNPQQKPKWFFKKILIIKPKHVCHKHQGIPHVPLHPWIWHQVHLSRLIQPHKWLQSPLVPSIQLMG